MYYHTARQPMLRFLSFLSFPTEIRISLAKIQEIKLNLWALGFSYYVARYFPTEEYTHLLVSLKQFHLIDGEAT